MPTHGDGPDITTTPTINTPERARDLISGGTSRTPASARVVAAGVSLFSEVGFLATTIRDLTRACGLTAGAFYNHFGSKETLLYAIISEANATLESQVDLVRLDPDDPRAALENLVRTLVTFNLSNPREARVANREYVFLQPALRTDVVAHRRRVLSAFEDVLASSAASRGLLSDDVSQDAADMEIRLLAISIVNLTIASPDWYSPEGVLTVPQVADAYCRLALRMAGLASAEQA